MIEPGREGEPDDRKDAIALPKGNVDGDEQPLEAAIREVHEETGLSAKPVAKLADIKYVYSRKWSDNAKISKVVSFFLMKYQSGQIGDIIKEMRHEVRHAYWIPLAQAPSRLRYNGERLVAKKGLEYLKSHPEEF